MTEPVSCAICLDSISIDKNCMITECGHSFHTSCIMKNAAFDNYDCPYCRTQMATKRDNDDETATEGDFSDGYSDRNEQRVYQINYEEATEYFNDFWESFREKTESELIDEELERQCELSEVGQELNANNINNINNIINNINNNINNINNNIINNINNINNNNMNDIPKMNDISDFLKTKGIAMEDLLWFLLNDYEDFERYGFADSLNDKLTPEYLKTQGIIFNNIHKYMDKYRKNQLHHIIKKRKLNV